jgi:hypothetical protein
MINEIANIETATDRDLWKGLVEVAKGLNGPYTKTKK